MSLSHFHAEQEHRSSLRTRATTVSLQADEPGLVTDWLGAPELEGPDDSDDSALFDVSGDPSKAAVTAGQTAPYAADFEVLLAKWKEDYKTALDLACAPLSPIPILHTSNASQATKHTTQGELKLLNTSKELKYIVFLPHMLDKLEEEATKILQGLPLEWKLQEHIMFVAHCLSEIAEPLLPGPVVYNEEDILNWCDHTLFRPAVALARLFRTAQRKEFSLVYSREEDAISSAVSQGVPSLKASLCSARHGKIIPDRLFMNGPMREGTRSVPETLATIEIKTPHVFDLELFQQVLRLPPHAPHESHTMRFCWPETLSSLKQTRDRILVQVWAQMTADEGPTDKVKTEYSALTSHCFNLYFMRSDEHPNTLFVSRQYSYDRHPVLQMFCLFAMALGLLDAPVLPPPDLREEIRRDYPGKAGLISKTCYTP